MLKVYSKNMDPEYLEDKKKVHQDGLWHKVFGGIVYNKASGTLYFQTIYPKESYTFSRPDYIDFGVGGHIEDEETVFEAGLREIKEELGQILPKENLHLLGIRICNCDPSPTYKIREFQYFYGIEITTPLKEMNFDLCDEEVKSFIEVKIDDFIKLLNKDIKQITANEMVLDKTTRKGTYHEAITITQDRIIPDYFTDKSIIEKILTLKSIINEEI